MPSVNVSRVVASALPLGAASAIIALALGTPSKTTVIRPDTTCTSSSPCLSWANSQTGAGVLGQSAGSIGVQGRTTVASSASRSGAGILGIDVGTGTLNAGVTGNSARGTGVVGHSANDIGVWGKGGPQGLSATSASGGFAVLGSYSTGVLARGQPSLIAENTTDPSSDGLFANGFGGYLFRVTGPSGEDVFSVTDAGVVNIINSQLSTFAPINANSMQIGSIGSKDVYPTYSVEGSNVGGSGDAVFANGHGYDLFDGAPDVSGADNFTVDDGGNVHAHSFTADLDRTRQLTSAGVAVSMPVEQSADPLIEDFGTAWMDHGKAIVHLDPAFASTMDPKSTYVVYVTGDGDNDGLYVSQRTPSYFEVEENGSHAHSLAFDYRIEGRPYRAHVARLEAAPAKWEARHPKMRPRMIPMTPTVITPKSKKIRPFPATSGRPNQ